MGANSIRNGMLYEKRVAVHMSKFKYLGKSIHVERIAGATHGCDLVLNIAPPEHQRVTRGSKVSKKIAIECKNRGAFEAGSTTLRLSRRCSRYIPFSANRTQCLFANRLRGYNAFAGRVPAFLRGNRSVSTWTRQMRAFRDEWIKVPTRAHGISRYYRLKGVDYIQIEGMGLYHTGVDVMGWNVPMFKPNVSHIRIRCKRHGSSTVPSSIQASFVYKRKDLKPSPVDLMRVERLPDCFQMK
jgi:hypothetical protein